jgi:hypothetical protein
VSVSPEVPHPASAGFLFSAPATLVIRTNSRLADLLTRALYYSQLQPVCRCAGFLGNQLQQPVSRFADLRTTSMEKQGKSMSLVMRSNTLTTSVDSFTPTGNSVSNGIIGGLSTTTPSTFTAADKIVATGANNTLNIVDVSTAGGTALPAAATVSGVQTVNLTAAGQSGADNFSGFTGLTTLNVTEAGGAAGITAAGTTAITLTDSAAAALAINVQGGSNVSVTGNAVNGSSVGGFGVTAAFGTINVGTTTAATGTVTVVANQSATATGVNGGDNINVTGGTVDTITANLSEKAGLGNNVTGGAITVTGTSATTTVTVNQTAAVLGAPASTATTGSPVVTAVTAAPGVTAVAAALATSSSVAKAAVAGVVDGAVHVVDASYGTTAANTITTVSLGNYGASSNINDNALTTLSLSGTAGTLTINNATNGTLTPASNPTLSLTLNGLSASVLNGGNNTILDTNGEIKTLNVTTSTADSVLTGFSDSGLKTLNISGTNALKFGTGFTLANDLALTSVTVSGAAGFSDGNTGIGTGFSTFTGATLTTTSTGTITAALNDTLQTFTGASGRDVITISDLADATKAITAGSATNNELILDGGTYALTAATAKLVTGFQTVGVTSTVTSAGIDLSILDATANSLDFIGNNAGASGAVTFFNVASGASISLDANTSGAIVVDYKDTTGAADSTTVTIGSATNALGITTGSLALADANGVGVGTVNIVSNDVAYSTTNLGNTITTLVDTGVANLNVSGSGALTIGTLADNATSFTLNNTDAGVGGLTISTLTDATLGNLSFTGSGASTITALNDSATVLNIANTGTGVVNIGTLTDALSNLSLTGNVALGQATSANALLGLQDSATSGVVVSGATDNAHVTVNLTAGASAGLTDSITLGNGNNYVLDASTAGKVNITVGTGSNLIDVHTAGLTNSTYAANITLGAHTAATGIDSIFVSSIGTNAGTNTIITGAVAGDLINFTDVGAAGAVALVGGAPASVAAGIAAAHAAITGTNHLASFQFGGNTYVVEDVAAGTSAATSTVVELIGAHTFGTAAAGHVALAS